MRYYVRYELPRTRAIPVDAETMKKAIHSGLNEVLWKIHKTSKKIKVLVTPIKGAPKMFEISEDGRVQELR